MSNNSLENIKDSDVDQIIKNRESEISLDVNNPNLTNKMTNFDVKKFNVDFDVDKALKEKLARERDKKKLATLEKVEVKKPIYQLSIGEILIGIKDVWFEIIDDLLQQRFSFDIFTKGNRLFFIGLTIAIIVLIIYLYELLTDDESDNDIENKKNINTKVKEIHHVYHLVKSPDPKNLDKMSELTRETQKNVVLLAKPDRSLSDNIDELANVNIGN